MSAHALSAGIECPKCKGTGKVRPPRKVLCFMVRRIGARPAYSMGSTTELPTSDRGKAWRWRWGKDEIHSDMKDARSWAKEHADAMRERNGGTWRVVRVVSVHRVSGGSEP